MNITGNLLGDITTIVNIEQNGLEIYVSYIYVRWLACVKSSVNSIFANSFWSFYYFC